MNKIISFSLYGNNDLYCIGIIENIDIINDKYNNWKIYIYYNNIPNHIFDILKNKNNVYLFECKHNGYKWEGMFWRFYPIENNEIDYFLSRDADSRITDREMSLVDEWIKTNKTFHIIRDHPFHGTEILGGTFGINVKQFNKLYHINTIDYYKENLYLRFQNNIERWPDQIFLKEIIYPLIKDDNLTHISYDNLRFSNNDVLINPLPNNFIGMVVEPTTNIL